MHFFSLNPNLFSCSAGEGVSLVAALFCCASG